MTVNNDIYFGDFLVGDKPDLANTVRVYTNGAKASGASYKGKKNSSELILVAPYQMTSLAGSNEWGSANKTIFGSLAQGIGTGIQDVTKTVQEEISGFRGVDDSHSAKVLLDSNSIVKSYEGSAFQLPISTISVVYYSDNRNSLTWWKGDSTGDKSLKAYSRYMLETLVGNIDTPNGTRAKQATMTAPNGFTRSADNFIVHNGTLVVAVGDSIYIDNILPKSISITPSRYLTYNPNNSTSSHDYFSIEVVLELDSSKLITTKDITSWIPSS